MMADPSRLRGRRMLFCHPASQSYALGPEGHIWRQERLAGQWQEAMLSDPGSALEGHARAMKLLARAVPIVRLYMRAATKGEAMAACNALSRIGRALTRTWPEDDAPEDETERERFHDAAEIYRLVTLDCRDHMADDVPPPYDPAVFARLRDLSQANAAAAGPSDAGRPSPGRYARPRVPHARRVRMRRAGRYRLRVVMLVLSAAVLGGMAISVAIAEAMPPVMPLF